eukprot:g15029.t1
MDPPLSGTLQVVCPSYGRTGTKSMKVALEILGFGPCYHMETVFEPHAKDHPKLWLDGFEGRGLAVNKIFDGYKSVGDWPASDFYKEILAANPDAKVVVTQREPDAWWKSMSSTISRKNPAWNGWGLFFMEVLFSSVRITNRMILHIKTCRMDEEPAKADYIRHTQQVLAHVPPHKLLEFSVKQGWEPLCRFLEVPVPEEPFPRVNSTADMIKGLKRGNVVGWVLMVTTITVGGASVAVATFFGGWVGGGVLVAVEVVALTLLVRNAVAMRRVPL